MPPIVPRIEQAGVATPFSSGRGATPDAFGAGVARGMARLGEGVSALTPVAAQIAAEDNERYAKDMDIKAMQAFRKRLYTDEDAFFGQKANNAVRAAPLFKEELNKITDDILGEAPNGAARAAAEGVIRRRLEGELLGMDKYTLQERKNANIATSQARIAETIEDASVHWNDNIRLSQYESVLKSEVLDQAEQSGASPEVTTQLLDAAVSDMYRTGVLSAISSGSASEAQELYNKNKTKIEAGQRIELENMLRNHTVLEQSQEHSDRIMAMGIGPREQLAEARKINDAHVRERTVQSIKRRQEEEAGIQRQELAAISSEVFKFVNEGGTLAQYAKQYPEAYAKMAGDAELIDKIYRAEDRVAEGRLFRRITDGKTMAGLRKLPPTEIAGLDPETLRGELTESEYSEFSNMQEAAVKLIEGNRTDTAIFRRGEQILKDLSPDLDWNSPNKEQQALHYELKNQLNAYITGFTSQGLKPTDEQIFDQASLLTTKLRQANTGWFFFKDDSVLAAQLPSMSREDRAALYIDLDDIRPGMLAEARDVFRTQGNQVEATDDQLRAFFKAQAFGDIAATRHLLGLPEIAPRAAPEPIAEQVDPFRELMESLSSAQEQQTASLETGMIAFEDGEVTEDFTNRIAQIESSGNPEALATTSTATGLFQYIDSTWLESIEKHEPGLSEGRSREEVLALRTDPDIATRIFKADTKENARKLLQMGYEPTPSNLYLVHLLGPTGARRALNAVPEARIEDVLGRAVVKANPPFRGKDIKFLKQWSERKVSQ